MSEKISCSAKGSLDISFIPSDGKTFVETNNGEESLFADFSLKLIGEIHSGRGSMGDHEGQWLASMTGLVFSQKITRFISLRGSDFDSKTSLLTALRAGFPAGSVTLAPGVKHEQVNAFWHWLVSQYEPDSGRKVYTTNHLGAQQKNYWVLNDEVHLWKNTVVPRQEHQFYVINIENLLPVSTVINANLLNRDFLIGSIKQLIDHVSYLGINRNGFILLLGFCLSRLLRSTNLDDIWGESNIGLVYSEDKNCGKSMALFILAKLQGLGSRHHPLLSSGGNQGTSGTSAKKILENLSKTTLINMVDDPLISKDLGEFLNQVQGGLMQGSAATGIFAPKGSILLSSNDKEVERIEGRVQRFTFVKDETFDLDERRERELMTFAEENKGLLIAWTLRFMSLWDQCVGEHVHTVQRAVRYYFPEQQIRWIRGMAYTILAKTMFLATVQQHCNVLKTLEDMVEKPTINKPTLPVMARFQRTVFEKAREEVLKVHTWINPFCSVKVVGSDIAEKAYGFAVAGINCLNSEINSKELSDHLKDIVQNGVSQPVSFGVDGNTPLADLRKKHTGLKTVATRRAHKVPLSRLEPHFIEWINFTLGLSDVQPEQEFTINMPEFENVLSVEHRPPYELVKEVEQLEQTVVGIMSEFNQRQEENNTAPIQSHYVENLSPSSRMTWDSFSPRRKHAFEMGARAAAKKAKTYSSVGTSTCTSQTENLESTELTVVKEKEIQFCPESKVATLRVEKTRKELFPDGAVGVIRTEGSKSDKSTSDKRRKSRRFIIPALHFVEQHYMVIL